MDWLLARGPSDAVLLDHAPVPEGAQLRRALAGREIAPDNPESLREAETPLEVVEQRPDQVAAQIDTVGDRAVAHLEMALDVDESLPIDDAAVRTRGLVVVAGPVLGHVQRQPV